MFVTVKSSSPPMTASKTFCRPPGTICRRPRSIRPQVKRMIIASHMDDYDREIIKVATGGSAVGRANGLSVTLFGDYEFGLPHQISCTVGVGHGGILDLEREAQLGGPIHTKGMQPPWVPVFSRWPTGWPGPTSAFPRRSRKRAESKGSARRPGDAE